MNKRELLLAEIRKRMQDNGIFYDDIWKRLLKTDVAVLQEIANSNFEKEVLSKSKHM